MIMGRHGSGISTLGIFIVCTTVLIALIIIAGTAATIFGGTK